MIKVWQNNIKKYKSAYGWTGFGIIEVVIAVGIMAMVISGAAILEKNAMKTSVANAERTQAYNLAREGIEGYRAIRDTSWVDNDPQSVWNADVNLGADNLYNVSMNCADGNSQCNWQLSSIAEPAVITLDNSQFLRKITFESIDNTPISAEITRIVEPQYSLPTDTTWDNFMVKIKVEVSWTSYGKTNTVSASEILTDWKPVY